MDENIKAFVVYFSSLRPRITIHAAREAQIAKLLAKEVTFLAKYLGFADLFSEEPANLLLKQTVVNEHAIELKKGKKLTYRPIYNLRPVELKTLKGYIETNLSNGFIRDLKSLVNASILFV